MEYIGQIHKVELDFDKSRRKKMNTIAILRIESNNEALLASNDATQEIYPFVKNEVKRNLNFTPIPSKNNCIKYKCLIKTKDIPNFNLLGFEKVYKIHSIVKLQEQGTCPSIEYVPDSIEKYDGFILFRPIFDTLLLNFKCKENNTAPPLWELEFEQI
ncbi:MAG: hypothetical protein LBF70_01925 [Holosporales bacterium]|jgi:hypothetical protein|nr:hypothetical protein [Holosporales bacterium]